MHQQNFFSNIFSVFMSQAVKGYNSLPQEKKKTFSKFLSAALQSLVGRLKENLEKMTEEKNQHITAENREKEQNKRMQRQVRDMKEEMAELSKKEAEASRKKHELVRVYTLSGLTCV